MSLSEKLKRSIHNTILGIGLVGMLASCNANNDPPPGDNVPCPFNPAVEYVQENNVLNDFDVAGFGTNCKWNPVHDANREPSSFLNESTRNMIDWMAEIDNDVFYTDDQIQSLVTRFGEGVINPETGQRVTNDTGRVNVDEYLASRDFYEQAKEMHTWAVANQHRAASINPDHYKNFNAWSVRLYGWMFPDPVFSMPRKVSLLSVTGLEPSVALSNYTPVNWNVSIFGTPEYEPMNFIGLEAETLGKTEWGVCSAKVEAAHAASQVFNLDAMYLMMTYGNNVLVQNMLYSEGIVVDKSIESPPGVDWYDMSLAVEFPVSATLMDIGGYENGHRLTMHYSHLSGENGNMYDERMPNIDDKIAPRAIFGWLNSQRPTILADFQGYVPVEAGIPGPIMPPHYNRSQVDMFFEGAPVGKKAGWNDPRANRHDAPTNYATAIGNRSIFSPCAVDEDYNFIHEPKE